MAAISIPESRLAGFTRLTNMSNSEAEAIANSLSKAPLDKGPSGVSKFVAEASHVEGVKDIVQSIISTISLIPQYETLEELADEFIDSYKGDVEDSSEEGLRTLRNNLIIIWKETGVLKQAYKSSLLIRHEERIYKSSKIVSDIRLLFDNDLAAKERSAIILHDMGISFFTNNGEEQTFHATLSNDDLKNLKTQIERAIEKEELIKQDYTSINFIPANL